MKNVLRVKYAKNVLSCKAARYFDSNTPRASCTKQFKRIIGNKAKLKPICC